MNLFHNALIICNWISNLDTTNIRLDNANASSEKTYDGAYEPFYASNPIKYVQDEGNWFELTFNMA